VYRWIAVVPILVGGASIGGVGMMSATSVAEVVAATLSQPEAVERPPVKSQEPESRRVHQKHRLLHRPKPSEPDPRTAFAKTRPLEFADARTDGAGDGEDIPIKPNYVATVSVRANPSGVEVHAELTALRDELPAMPSVTSAQPPARPASSAMKLMMLLSTVAVAAMGGYGLMAFNSRRQVLQPSRSQPTGNLSTPELNLRRESRQKRFQQQSGSSWPADVRKYAPNANANAINGNREALWHRASKPRFVICRLG
jgi:hypothetical protein